MDMAGDSKGKKEYKPDNVAARRIMGSCGDNVIWQLDLDTGCLTISGEGPMADYTSEASLPWRFCTADIRSVVVTANVTKLGDYAFSTCINLSSVSMAGTVEILGTYAFNACVSLNDITLPEGLRIIGAKTFSGCGGLQTVHLPISLTNIDMKAFDGNSALKDVYYGGTGILWSQIEISRSSTGNDVLLNANFHCLGTSVDVAACYEDVEVEDWFVASVQYLMDYGYLGRPGNFFGTRAAADMEFVLEILYQCAGAPGMYVSARDWAGNNSLIESEWEERTLSLARLAVILQRTGKYNGTDVSGADNLITAVTGTDGIIEEERAALAWCWDKGYLDEMMRALGGINAANILTGGAAASILAAYLSSDASVADRYWKIAAIAKTALKQGGDSKLYILVPDLFVSGVTAKSGDCQLIIFPNGQTMMVDAGYTACTEHVILLLDALELTSLDYFVLSHPHSDHVGGALAVARHIYDNGGTIGNYYCSPFHSGNGKRVNDIETEFVEYLKMRKVPIVADVKRGDQWTVGDVTINVYNPDPEEAINAGISDTDVNNVSLLLKFNYGDSTYMTGGDLYRTQERELVTLYGNALSADVIKTNHHGTYTSSCEEWLTAVSPLITFSSADDIGGTVLSGEIAEMGTVYYSTGVDGLLMIVMGDSRDYRVITQRDSVLRKNHNGLTGRL